MSKEVIIIGMTRPKVKQPISLHFEAEMYTAIDKGKELKTSSQYEEMERWAKRHNYVIVDVVGLDD